MKMDYNFSDQVRKWASIDFPAGGSILHIWKFGEKHPLCKKQLTPRGGLVLLNSNYCAVCVRRAQPN